MPDPSVAAIVVNWNHRHLLAGCLDALLAQRYPALSVTVVDNGSRDGSADWLAGCYPALRLHALGENRGFSAALNWGIRHTESDYVLSLNPDTRPRPDFVGEMVRAMGRDRRVGLVAPKLLRSEAPPVLDSTGLFIDRRRRPYDRGQGEIDRGQYDHQSEVFGACGAAALYRRAMLGDTAIDGEVFDELFHAYYEDADLSWRAQARGWRCVYAPAAVAVHLRGGGDRLRTPQRGRGDARGPRLALRNRYLMAVKNDRLKYFVADLPAIVAAELPRLAYAAVARPAVLLGLADLARAWPEAARKRRQVARLRTVDPAVTRRWFVAR